MSSGTVDVLGVDIGLCIPEGMTPKAYTFSSDEESIRTDKGVAISFISEDRERILELAGEGVCDGELQQRHTGELYLETFDPGAMKAECRFQEGISIDFLLGRMINQVLIMFQEKLDMVFVHSASVIVDGAAHIFIAPSGGGKSTIAAAAGRHGHIVLNDELTVVRREGDAYLTGVFPVTPISVVNQARWPVKGVYILKKAGEDRIDTLSLNEALKTAVPECMCFFNRHFTDDEIALYRASAFDIISGMLRDLGASEASFSMETGIFRFMEKNAPV